MFKDRHYPPSGGIQRPARGGCELTPRRPSSNHRPSKGLASSYDDGVPGDAGYVSERIALPQSLRQVARRASRSYPRRSRRAPKLLNNCRTVVQQLSNKCSRDGPDLTKFRPNFVDVAEHSPMLARAGQNLSNLAEFGQRWRQIWLNFEQTWSVWPNTGRCWTNLAQTCHCFPTSANSGTNRPKLDLSNSVELANLAQVGQNVGQHGEAWSNSGRISAP